MSKKILFAVSAVVSALSGQFGWAVSDQREVGLSAHEGEDHTSIQENTGSLKKEVWISHERAVERILDGDASECVVGRCGTVKD
jgi:hypothetical protein